MGPLLHIQADWIEVRLEGPSTSNTGRYSGNAQGSGLHVRSSGGNAVVLAPREPKAYFALFEQTQYEIFVSVPEVQEELFIDCPDPTLVTGIRILPRGIAAGPINYKGQVGMSSLKFTDGERWLVVEFMVSPSKMDFLGDYQACLRALSDCASSLALEYMRATNRGVSHGLSQATDLEWVTTLSHEMARLEAALTYANEHPHRVLETSSQYQRLERIRRPSAQVVKNLMRGRGRGGIIKVGHTPAHEKVLSVSRHETLDTAEHRWLRQEVSGTIVKLRALRQGREASMPTKKSARQVAELGQLEAIEERAENLMGLAILRGASATGVRSVPSLVLQQGAGYAQAFRCLQNLRLALSIDAETLRASFVDIHEIYEVWCYLHVVRTVARVVGVAPDPKAFLQLDKDGYKVRLTRGEHIEVSLPTNDDVTALLDYNRPYQMATGSHQPDITITLRLSGRPDVVLVLDAKYRVDFSRDFEKKFGTPGPPPDAVNALHRYRDALVFAGEGVLTRCDRGSYRPVVLGAALFPLPPEMSPAFLSRSTLWRSLGVVGIGAIPLLPSNSHIFDDWLAATLKRAIPDLEEIPPRLGREIEDPLSP